MLIRIILAAPACNHRPIQSAGTDYSRTRPDVNLKVKKIIDAGLKPIMCGETDEEREKDYPISDRS